MNLPLKLILISTLIGYLQPVCAEVEQWPQSITIITNDQHPVISNISNNAIKLNIYNLDAVDKVESRLGLLLPADEDQALKVMEQRIAQSGQVQLELELAQAYKGLTLAISYDLDRYPAIIFDEQAVIYGMTDLSLATNKYLEWVQGNKEVSFDE